MARKAIIFLTTIILVGVLDWFTTTMGVTIFGATESNPLMACLTQSNLLLFSAIKLAAIAFTGFAFYLADIKMRVASQVSPFTRNFLNSGFAICILTLSVAVLNNLIVIVNAA